MASLEVKTAIVRAVQLGQSTLAFVHKSILLKGLPAMYYVLIHSYPLSQAWATLSIVTEAASKRDCKGKQDFLRFDSEFL